MRDTGAREPIRSSLRSATASRDAGYDYAGRRRVGYGDARR